MPDSLVGVIERLIAFLPELRPAWERERECWRPDTPVPYPFFGDVLWPHIEEAASAGDSAALYRAFGAIENLVEAGDRDVHDLIALEVCQRLASDPQSLQAVRRYMGRGTRKLLRRWQPAPWWARLFRA